MKEMEQKNVDKCIVSMFFNVQYNQSILYKLDKCKIKENIYIYYKNLKYNEYLFLKTILKTHKLFINCFKEIKGNDTFYVFSFSLNKDKKRLISLISNGYYNFLTPTVKQHILTFTNINLQ